LDGVCGADKSKWLPGKPTHEGRIEVKNFLTTVSGIVAGLMTILAAQPVAAADSARLNSLYAPDLVDAKFAEALDGGSVSASGLDERMPFNADMVNVEKIVGDGEGVYVAVLDTGLLQDWPFFFSQANIAWDLGKGFSHDVYWDDTIGDIVIGPLKDDRGFITELASGHGTHVTSTVVGFNVNNSYWVRGVAPKATIIPVLVLDAWVVNSPYGPLGFSGGTDEMVAAGIRYVADLELDGRVVINMSLGGPSRSAMIEDAVNYAISKGVVVVASAGNSGSDGMGYPGGLPQVISTAAAGWASMFLSGWRSDVPEKQMMNDALGNNTQFYLEDFSSRPKQSLGQKHQDLDVAAPGAFVVGPYKSAFSSAVGYYYLSGTSMAAPHVSAIAAMLLGQEPSLSQAGVERRLRSAANGNPLPADGAIVAYPGANYRTNWDGGDYGAGFLRADYVVN
jgi:subtilisin family serine protease